MKKENPCSGLRPDIVTYARFTALWLIKTKCRRVFDAGRLSLKGSALHGVVFEHWRPETSWKVSTAMVQA